jgi:NTE family protein
VYVQKQLLHKSQKRSLEELKGEYFRLLADDKINYIFPSLIYNPVSRYFTMQMDVQKEKMFHLQYGGHFSSSAVNEAFLELKYKYLSRFATTVLANSYIGRFYSSAQIKTKVEFPSKRPYFIEGDITFNQWDYFKTSTYFFEDKTPSYLIQNENHIHLGAGIPLTHKGKIALSAAYGDIKNDYYQNNIFLREDTADRTVFNFFTSQALLELNTITEKQFARNGSLFSISLNYVSGDEKFRPGSTSDSSLLRMEKFHDYFLFRLKYDNYFKELGFVKLGFYSELVYSSQSLFNNYTSSLLASPAFQPFPESKTFFIPKYRAFIFAGFGIKQIYRLYKNINFRLEGYVFQPYQEILKAGNGYSAVLGKKWDARHLLGSSALVYNSPLGPLSISLNWYENSAKPLSLIFSFGYIIYNHKAIE